jgi:hypothetical protein
VRATVGCRDGSTAMYMLRTASCCHGCAGPDGGDQTARLEDAPQQHVQGRGGEIDRWRRRLANEVGHTRNINTVDVKKRGQCLSIYIDHPSGLGSVNLLAFTRSDRSHG